MHKIESREISNRKYLPKTILACRERQAYNWKNKHSASDKTDLSRTNCKFLSNMSVNNFITDKKPWISAFRVTLTVASPICRPFLLTPTGLISAVSYSVSLTFRKYIRLADSLILLFWFIFQWEMWTLPWKNWENSIFPVLKGDNSLKQNYQGEVINFCHSWYNLSMSTVAWPFRFNIVMLTPSCMFAF